ncbi:glutathione S-transferase T1-like isoform X2 [Salvia hispanica]|uniref:glutathione S-transferase T1-like isoform X2 n=2 Tax=Salvia hispanica TaxID=49212 RepID=UPI002009CE49|nr:glutathione S-transferase T1-like isoform X2 [Salvia hispanica]
MILNPSVFVRSKMELKVYCDRMSQPSRAILIFCKANNAEFEEVTVEIGKGQHRTPEFAEVNPMKQVPAVIHGDFKLFESHAILIYLASTIPGVADHWYPADVRERAKVHSVLDWHHTNLRRGSVGYLLNTVFAVAFGMPGDPKAAAEGEKLLSASLARIESFWLQGGPFLLGNSKPTIADLALACEVTQLEVADQNDHDRIMEPHSKIVKWLKDVKSATTPHFEEIHAAIRAAREPLKKLKAQAAQKSE